MGEIRSTYALTDDDVTVLTRVREQAGISRDEPFSFASFEQAVEQRVWAEANEQAKAGQRLDWNHGVKAARKVVAALIPAGYAREFATEAYCRAVDDALEAIDKVLKP